MKKSDEALLKIIIVIKLMPIVLKIVITTIEIWTPWAPDHRTTRGLEEATAASERVHLGVEVVLKPGTSRDEFLVADFEIPALAARELVQPLTPFLERDGYTADDFFPAGWMQVRWREDTWALPLTLDPNFALLSNRRLLEEAGIPGDASPKTISELDEWIRRLTRFDEAGTAIQIGMAAWNNAWGQPNNLYTWGWAFGGEFYDPVTDTATLDHPQVIAALEWLADHHMRYRVALEGKDGYFVQRFIQEQEVMITTHAEVIGEIQRANPDIPLTLGMMPHHDEHGPENPAWVGGWNLAIAKGSKHPDLAWELLKFLAADAQGTGIFGVAASQFPSYRYSEAYSVFLDDPIRRVFAQILETAQRVRPVTTETETFNREIQQAVSQVLNGELPARPALEDANRRVNQVLSEVRNARR